MPSPFYVYKKFFGILFMWLKSTFEELLALCSMYFNFSHCTSRQKGVGANCQMLFSSGAKDLRENDTRLGAKTWPGKKSHEASNEN